MDQDLISILEAIEGHHQRGISEGYRFDWGLISALLWFIISNQVLYMKKKKKEKCKCILWNSRKMVALLTMLLQYHPYHQKKIQRNHISGFVPFSSFIGCR
jgi:hypothetical protein